MVVKVKEDQALQIEAKDMRNVYHQIVNFDEHVGISSGQI